MVKLKVRCIALLQVLAYARHARESSMYEQAALSERMQEYKRQINVESQRSFSMTSDSSTGDAVQAFPRSSHKVIEAVMHCATEGKVFNVNCFCHPLQPLWLVSFYHLFLSLEQPWVFIYIAKISIV